MPQFRLERRDAQEDAQQHDALHALLKVGARGNFLRDPHGIQREQPGVLLAIRLARAQAGIEAQISAGSGLLALHEHHSVLRQSRPAGFPG